MSKLHVLLFIGLAISSIIAHETIHNRHNGLDHEHSQNHGNVDHAKNRHHGSHLKNKNHVHGEHTKNNHHEHIHQKAHEKNAHQREHHIPHNSKHFSLNHVSYHSRHHQKNRENSPQNATSSNSSLEVCYNPRTSTQIIYNQLIGSGLALNFSAQIVVIFNDETRRAIGFNFETQIGVEITNRNSTSWEQILSQTSSLEHFIQIGEQNGTSFNLSAIPSEISDSAQNILRNLSSDYSLQEFLNDTQSVIDLFRRAPNIFNSFQAQFRNGFRSFVQRLLGIRSILSGFPNGTAFGNVTLNPSEIFNPETGLNAFISVIQQLGRVFNPATFLGQNFTQNLLSSANRFGCSCNSFDRFLRLINQIVQILAGGRIDSNFIPSLISSFGNFSNFPNLLNQWRASFGNLSDLLRNSSGFENGLGELENLANQTGLVNGYNLTNIFNILQNVNNTNSINSLVKLLVSLSRNVPPQFSIPSLLGQIVGLYRNSTNGQNPILQNLFPNLGNDQDRDNNNNIVSQFVNLFQNGAQLFIGIPLQIFLLPISLALNQCSNGTLSLSNVMQSPESLSNFANPAGFANIITGAANGFAHLASSVIQGFANLPSIPIQLFQQGLGNVLGSGSSNSSNPLIPAANNETGGNSERVLGRNRVKKEKHHSKKEKKHDQKEKLQH